MTTDPFGLSDIRSFNISAFDLSDHCALWQFRTAFELVRLSTQMASTLPDTEPVGQLRAEISQIEQLLFTGITALFEHEKTSGAHEALACGQCLIQMGGHPRHHTNGKEQP